MSETNPLQGCLSAIRKMFGGSQPASRQPSIESRPVKPASIESRPVTPPSVASRPVEAPLVKTIVTPDIDVQALIQQNWEAVQTFLPSRTIVLRGEITDDTANRLIGHLLLLERLSSDPIMLILNSTGGQAYGGLAVYDTLRHLSVPLITVAETMCAGSALLLLLAGHKRYALAATEVTYTTLTTMAAGAPSDLVIHSREIQRLQLLHNTIFQQHMGGATPGWDLGVVHEFTQQEALEYRLIDAVVERIEDIEQ